MGYEHRHVTDSMQIYGTAQEHGDHTYGRALEPGQFEEGTRTVSHQNKRVTCSIVTDVRLRSCSSVWLRVHARIAYKHAQTDKLIHAMTT